jgi:23S rRNA (adenine2503-C2)-methyltransferase
LIDRPLVQVETLRRRLRALGAHPQHESHVLRRWLHNQPLDQHGRRRVEDWLPRALRDALPALTEELAGFARFVSTHPAADGSARCLVALADGQTVESVLLPRREGLCVSTQVGCAVGCTFCMTGTMGLQRQLGSAEIAAQVALARTQRAVAKVVFMGMGEPAHNLDAVMEAIDTLGREGGIGHKQLVLSTVGDTRVFERLAALGADAVKPALALSLHTMSDTLRRELLPRAPCITVDELIEQGERYARAVRYPIQYQWTLMAGVNDGDDEIEGIVAKLRGKHAILNMIPYNRVEGFAYARPSAERCTAIFRSLNQRGVLTRLRQSAGQDVDAGCGQLRSRAVIALRAA